MTPTLKQICEKATQGPWKAIQAHEGAANQQEQSVPILAAIQGEVGPDVCRFVSGPSMRSNAQLIARCSPQNMLAVVEALEWAHNAAPKQSGLRVACARALSLLNGTATSPQ